MANSVHQARDLARLSGEPATGLPVIPLDDSAAIEVPWDSAVAKKRGIFGFDSMDPRSRSFNMIRARLIDFHASRGWRLLGVVSATPHVGRSFIAANVAAALSRDPRFRTHAVDFDLRRGSLSGIFGIDEAPGIKGYLEGGTAEQAAPPSYRLEGERLRVLPTSAGQVRSAELLAGERAQTLLRSMRVSDENSFFVVDLPPVFANDDAATVMARLDAYVLVAEEGKTKQREVRDAVNLLGEARLAGVILNKYRGGVISEGYGVDEYYARGYGDEAAGGAQ